MKTISTNGLLALAKTLGVPLRSEDIRNWVRRGLLSAEVGEGTPGRERLFTELAAAEVLLFASIAAMDVPLVTARAVLIGCLPQLMDGQHYLVIARRLDKRGREWEAYPALARETLEGATVNMSDPEGGWGPPEAREIDHVQHPNPFVCIPAPEIIAAVAKAVEETKND